MAIVLEPHQLAAVDKLESGKVLWGDVGTGKSIVALAYYMKQTPAWEEYRDVYVITTAKKRDDLDWQKDALDFKIGQAPDETMAGILTVDSWNNIDKYLDVKDAFFIFDEQRAVGAGKWSKSFIKIAKKNRWIMLSATPGDTWLDYIPVFVANGWYTNRTDFKRRHVVYAGYSKYPKVDHYVDTGILVRLRNQLLVEMPYKRHTVRHIQDIIVPYDEQLMQKVVKDRWHVYENRPIANTAELFSVMRKVANSNTSRIDQVRSLMVKHPKLIVFYNFDYELESLRTLGQPLGQTQSNPSGKKQNPSNLGNPQMKSLQELSEQMQLDDAMLNVKAESPDDLLIMPRQSDLTTSSIGSKASSSTCTPTNSSEQSRDRSFTDLETLMCSAMSRDDGTFDLGLIMREQCREASNLQLSQSTENLSPKSNSKSEWNESSTMTPGSSSATTVIAEWNGHKHEPIPDSDSWVYLVQYVAGSEGWNCIDTDAICFYSLTYSYKNFHQAQGRTDRLNTPFTDLYYYVLRSKAQIDTAIRKSLRSKKNFNESDYYAQFERIR